MKNDNETERNCERQLDNGTARCCMYCAHYAKCGKCTGYCNVIKRNVPSWRMSCSSFIRSMLAGTRVKKDIN